MSQKKIPTSKFTFRVASVEGRKKLELQAGRFYQHWVNQHTRVGDIGTMEIKMKKPTRTETQLRYYAVLVDMIAEHTGYLWDEVHDALMKLKWGTRSVKIGGQTVEVRRSISDRAKFPKFDMADQIEFALEKCAELEIRVPTREELGYLPK